MNDKCCVSTRNRDSIDPLRAELVVVDEQIHDVKLWGLTEETMGIVLKELEAKRNEIKERFHNLIDTL